MKTSLSFIEGFRSPSFSLRILTKIPLLILATALTLARPCTGAPFTWQFTGSLSTPRYYHTATLLPNGKVLAAAGATNSYYSFAELYDPASGKWTTTGSSARSRFGHTATLLPNGQVLVAAGSLGGGDSTSDAQLYDSASETWTTTGHLAVARGFHTATLLQNGKVLVAGGFAFSTFVNAAELYDPATGTWTTTGSLSTYRGYHTATLLPNGKVLVAGGYNNGNNSSYQTAELYDPATGIWTSTGSLATARFQHTASLLPNGKVLVAGGSNGAASFASAELYDPASGTWTATGNLNTARGYHTATLLASGTVLVAGGDGTITSAELYDPANGTWTATGSLNGSRGEHTATLLRDGRVLVAAGFSGSNSIASAEIFDSSPPAIASPQNARATSGQQFLYQFVAYSSTSRSATNLPPGLTFNAELSSITGTPTTTGTFETDLSATGPGGTANAKLTITVQPAPTSGPVMKTSTSATGRVGQLFRFQVATTGGSPDSRLSASGLPAGLSADPITGVISGIATSAGSSAVTLTVTDGSLSETTTLQLTFTSDAAVPVIVSSDTATIASGQPFTYTISAPATADASSDPTKYTLIGELPPGLFFDPKTGTISGTYNGQPLRDGDSDLKALSGPIVDDVQLFATNSHGTTSSPLLFSLAVPGPINISTRLAVGSGDNVLIGGFFVAGNAPKKLLIRAAGPSLTAFGVTGALQDTMLELHQGSTVLSSNDDWKSSQEQEIKATGLAPKDTREAAILATLAPGGYTAIVRGKDGTGVALAEIYDLGTASLDSSSISQLTNISTRGTVSDQDNVMIGGFIISGTATKVIIRAIGPELSDFGVSGALQDTILELHDGMGSLITSNDDWRTTQEQEIINTTLQPKDDRESAILATLNPGNYTAIVRGKVTPGVALVEVYKLR